MVCLGCMGRLNQIKYANRAAAREKESPKPKPKPIRARSDKRSKQERIYKSKRYIYLMKPENRLCQVKSPKCTKVATQVHHMKGRIGELLINEDYWLPSCHECNVNWIEQNSAEAREKGFTINRGHKINRS